MLTHTHIVNRFNVHPCTCSKACSVRSGISLTHVLCLVQLYCKRYWMLKLFNTMWLRARAMHDHIRPKPSQVANQCPWRDVAKVPSEPAGSSSVWDKAMGSPFLIMTSRRDGSSP
jgi:hypothetical protein